MRHSLLLVGLLAVPLWGSAAGPAGGPMPPTRSGAGGLSAPEGAGSDPNRDQRRAAVRQALAPQQDNASPAPEGGAGRQLTPGERAELRRQLKELSGR